MILLPKARDVIPVPHQVRDRLQPESGVFNRLRIVRIPVPDRVEDRLSAGTTTFYKPVINELICFFEERASDEVMAWSKIVFRNRTGWVGNS